MSIFLSYIRGPSITFQMLFYPVTDACFATPSYNTLHKISRRVRKREVMRWFWNNHLSNQTAFSVRRWQEKLLDPLLNQGPKHHKITKFKLNYSI
jgi:acetyl esterase/lipase